MNLMYQSELFMNKEIWLNITAKECLQTHCDSFLQVFLSLVYTYADILMSVGFLCATWNCTIRMKRINSEYMIYSTYGDIQLFYLSGQENWKTEKAYVVKFPQCEYQIGNILSWIESTFTNTNIASIF